MSMTLEQAVQMAKAIGMDLSVNHDYSHDPLQGYDRASLTKVVGNKVLTAICQNYYDEVEKHLNGKAWTLDEHIVNRHSFTVTRGKNKGFQGVAVRHMPSKYDAQDTTFVLYDPFKSEEVFCNTKSSKITVWRKGETSTVASHILKGAKSSLVRGQQVWGKDEFGKDIVGVVVAQPKQRNDSILFSVGVQWQNQAQESWTFPHLLRTEA